MLVRCVCAVGLEGTERCAVWGVCARVGVLDRQKCDQHPTGTVLVVCVGALPVAVALFFGEIDLTGAEALVVR